MSEAYSWKAAVWLGIHLGAVFCFARPVLSQGDPAGMLAEAAECLSSPNPPACLVPYFADRVYSPETMDLRDASPACGAAFRAAGARDGHGWYPTGEEFVACMWTAAARFPGSEMFPREVLVACLREGGLTRVGPLAWRKTTGTFFCELEQRGGSWVLTQIVLRP